MVQMGTFKLDTTGITQRENGTFRARAEYKNPITGKTERFDRSGFPTVVDAYNARQEFLKEVREKGKYSTLSKRTFEEVFFEHLANSGYKPATIKRKKSLYNNHIKKKFGDRYVNSITAGDITNFLFEMGKPTKDKKFGQDIKYSQEYIAGFYKLFTAFFAYAVRNKYAIEDVSKDVPYKDRWYTTAKKKKEGKRLSVEELAVIDKELKTTNLHPSFMIAIHTGLRISEIFGLLWDDIDFEHRVLKVNKQLLYDTENKIWYFSPPKTINSCRVVPMPNELVVYLQELRNKQLADKRKLGAYYRNDNQTGYTDSNGRMQLATGFNFVNVKPTGERLTSDSTKYATRKVEATTGKHRFLLDPNDETSSIDFSYHDFRHTYATICAENGVAVEDLQDILGHRKITTTKEFYLHKDKMNNPVRDERINKIFTELNADIDETIRVKEQQCDVVTESGSVNAEKSPLSEQVGIKAMGYFENGVYYTK